MPARVTSGRGQAPENVAFLPGAGLNHLHLVFSNQEVPQPLLRARLALRAAEVCVTHSGRPERASELRDAVAILQPGNCPGPAGETYLSWRRAVERPVSIKSLHLSLPEIELDQIATWLDGCDPCDGGGPRDASQGPLVPRAAVVLETVLTDAPRDLTAALILADAVLAQALGWTRIHSILAFGLERTDLRKTGADLRLACHRETSTAAAEATRDAVDLTRRVARLQAVAPKLRVKGADEAVALFLTQDAVAPAVLPSLRSDRARHVPALRVMSMASESGYRFRGSAMRPTRGL